MKYVDGFVVAVPTVDILHALQDRDSYDVQAVA